MQDIPRSKFDQIAVTKFNMIPKSQIGRIWQIQFASQFNRVQANYNICEFQPIKIL